MRSPSTSTSASVVASALTIVPPLISVRIGSSVVGLPQSGHPSARSRRAAPTTGCETVTRYLSSAIEEACEARGDQVWWNANAGNEPSIRIARRIGFRHERRYELVAHHAPLGTAGPNA